VPRFVRLEYRDKFAPAGLLCIGKSSRPCNVNPAMGVTGKTNLLKEQGLVEGGQWKERYHKRTVQSLVDRMYM